MIITKTPVRLPLGGGGTDLPFFYPLFGGEMVTASIDKYIYVAVSERKFYDTFRISYSKTEIVHSIREIENSRVREALNLLEIKEPLEINIISEVPGKSGLGGSSVFLVGLLKALHIYKREEVSSKRLAEEAAKIEIEILKEPIGKQDQYAAAFGSINSLKIDKKGNVAVAPIDISLNTINMLERNLHIFFTGILRSASEVLRDQGKEAKSDESKLNSMKQIKEIGIEIKNALEIGDTKQFGRLMNLHWETKKKTSGKISDPKIDDWYDLALKKGALGGKIMGAGGGGFFLFYCDRDPENFIFEMEKSGLKYVPFKFDLDGSKVLLNIR
ncbi:MAG: hypothetical protein KC516_01900 [Nanoarchaeota archaeon]|nr:hypothetical protein [Nanoarchaeota archaeon]